MSRELAELRQLSVPVPTPSRAALMQHAKPAGASRHFEADAAFQPRHAAGYRDYGDDRGEISDRLE